MGRCGRRNAHHRRRMGYPTSLSDSEKRILRRPPPTTRPLSHIRASLGRARPLREKWHEQYTRKPEKKLWTASMNNGRFCLLSWDEHAVRANIAAEAGRVIAAFEREPMRSYRERFCKGKPREVGVEKFEPLGQLSYRSDSVCHFFRHVAYIPEFKLKHGQIVHCGSINTDGSRW